MTRIRTALVSRLLSDPPILGSVASRMSWENKSFIPEAGLLHCEVDFMPATSNPTTLGLGGLDRETGMLQILVCSPQDTGVGQALSLISALKIKFYAGQMLSHEDIRVRVTRVQVSPQFPDNGFSKFPVVVHWDARLRRPS